MATSCRKVTYDLTMTKTDLFRPKLQAWRPTPASRFLLPQSPSLPHRSPFHPILALRVQDQSGNMVVKIRLSRFGKRHQPIYNIVVSQARYAAMLLSCAFGKTSCPPQSTNHAAPFAGQHAIPSQWKSLAPTIPSPASLSLRTRQTPSTRSPVYRYRRRGIRTYS